jgi:hypothetical protein
MHCFMSRLPVACGQIPCAHRTLLSGSADAAFGTLRSSVQKSQVQQAVIQLLFVFEA